MRYVLDASAVLAMFHGEAGGDRVTDRLEDAGISAVNAVEVGTRLLKTSGDLSWIRTALAGLRIPIVSFDADLADRAVLLAPATRVHGLSLADRACLALAIREGAVALTADRVWASLDVGCKIELIR